MVSQSAVNRKFERFIGYDAYNNTEAYQRKIREPCSIDEENAIPLGRLIDDPETGKEKWIKYIVNEKGHLIDPTNGKIIRKNIRKNIEKKVKE